jgi:hypothetical protein
MTSARGAASGKLMRLCAKQAAIAPEGAKIDGVVVHYPRLGYEITVA